MLLNELLVLNAERQPAKVAVETAERSITYDELAHCVERLARHLLNRGLGRGARVAVHWHNSVEMLELLLGVFRAGMVAVPINPRLKAPEIAFILAHSGARLCFSEAALAAFVNGVEVVSELPTRKCE